MSESARRGEHCTCRPAVYRGLQNYVARILGFRPIKEQPETDRFYNFVPPHRGSTSLLGREDEWQECWPTWQCKASPTRGTWSHTVLAMAEGTAPYDLRKTGPTLRSWRHTKLCTNTYKSGSRHHKILMKNNNDIYMN